jgi:activating signal cointegrator 1
MSGPDFYLPAISVWQPWASLLAHGVKVHETRSWAPSVAYIGKTFAICASKTTQGLDLFAQPSDADYTTRIAALRVLRMDGVDLHHLPLGCIVGVGQLVKAIRTSGAEIDSTERALGDWTPGRWAWRFEHMQRLVEPVPVQGKQGIFRVLYGKRLSDAMPPNAYVRGFFTPPGPA